MTDSFCCFAHCSIAANIFNSNVCATSCQYFVFPSAFEIPPPPPLNILSMPTMTVYASQIVKTVISHMHIANMVHLFSTK